MKQIKIKCLKTKPFSNPAYFHSTSPFLQLCSPVQQLSIASSIAMSLQKLPWSFGWTAQCKLARSRAEEPCRLRRCCRLAACFALALAAWTLDVSLSSVFIVRKEAIVPFPSELCTNLCNISRQSSMSVCLVSSTQVSSLKS